MKNLQSYIAESIVSERMIYRDLDQALTEYITNGIIAAWDDAGLEFTHQDIKDALKKIAKNYDVDKEISWARTVIK